MTDQDLKKKAEALVSEVESYNINSLQADNDLLRRMNIMYEDIKTYVENDSTDYDYKRDLSNVNTSLNRNRIRLFGK